MFTENDILDVQNKLLKDKISYSEQSDAKDYFIIHVKGCAFARKDRTAAWLEVRDSFYPTEVAHRWFFVYTNRAGKTELDNFPVLLTRTEVLKKLEGWTNVMLIEVDSLGFLPSETGSPNGPRHKPFSY